MIIPSFMVKNLNSYPPSLFFNTFRDFQDFEARRHNSYTVLSETTAAKNLKIVDVTSYPG